MFSVLCCFVAEYLSVDNFKRMEVCLAHSLMVQDQETMCDEDYLSHGDFLHSARVMQGIVW